MENLEFDFFDMPKPNKLKIAWWQAVNVARRHRLQIALVAVTVGSLAVVQAIEQPHIKAQHQREQQLYEACMNRFLSPETIARLNLSSPEQQLNQSPHDVEVVVQVCINEYAPDLP